MKRMLTIVISVVLLLGYHTASEAGPRESIIENAQKVDYSDGINEEEARALVEKFLLDEHPNWTGWTITLRDHGDFWRAVCDFGSVRTLNVDKKTGLIEDAYPDLYKKQPEFNF